MDGELKYIHVVWIPAIPAGMTGSVAVMRSGLGMQSLEALLLRLDDGSKVRRASTAVFTRKPWERYISDSRQ